MCGMSQDAQDRGVNSEADGASTAATEDSLAEGMAAAMEMAEAEDGKDTGAMEAEGGDGTGATEAEGGDGAGATEAEGGKDTVAMEAEAGDGTGATEAEGGAGAGATEADGGDGTQVGRGIRVSYLGMSSAVSLLMQRGIKVDGFGF